MLVCLAPLFLHMLVGLKPCIAGVHYYFGEITAPTASDPDPHGMVSILELFLRDHSSMTRPRPRTQFPMVWCPSLNYF